MYSSSTQRYIWTFDNEEEMQNLRKTANDEYIQVHGADLSDAEKEEKFLSCEEERLLCLNFERAIREFCRRFKPPMPIEVTDTALTYFRRLYIANTVMDYHPKIMMFTCTWLACKVEEFNVSLDEFVGNLKGDREGTAEQICRHENVVLQKLLFMLLVHHPWMPLQGLLMQIKVDNPTLGEEQTEKIKHAAEGFLENAIMTDVMLLHPPSQVAMAAVRHALKNVDVDFNSWVAKVMSSESKEQFNHLLLQLREIRDMVMKREITPPEKAKVAKIASKLEKCKNPSWNSDGSQNKTEDQNVAQLDRDRSLRIQQLMEDRLREERAGKIGHMTGISRRKRQDIEDNSSDKTNDDDSRDSIPAARPSKSKKKRKH